MKTHTHSFYTLFISLIITVLVLIPSMNNFKYNDHSKNWLNHDYGKNLLSSTEEYSVFMTEGGDNQVFSSLYFTYAEKLRQDVFPYDQKGNIFKRIYGDLRYVTADILEQRTDIVDRGLFTGQEPFYTEIRSLTPPYLVPYALGKPATYLTWKRPNQSKIGNFYYKNYGLMYKVQEIPYAIVDYVQPLKITELSAISNYLNEKLGRDISDKELDLWSDQMVEGGYISKSGQKISYIRDYQKPFKGDPTDSFIIRWDQIKNLPYYDYLSREIVISYSYEQISLLGNRIEELQKSLKNEKSPEIKANITKTIINYWDDIQNHIKAVKEVGYDSAATLHNVGIFYLTAADKYKFVTNNLIPQAIEMWEMSIASAPYAWSSYNILLWSYLRQSFIDPANNEIYLEKFDIVHEKLKKNLSHWKSMKKDVTQSEPYRQSIQMFDMREQYENFSGKTIIDEQNAIQKMVDGTMDFSLKTVQDYVGKMVNQLTFIDKTSRATQFFTLWKEILNKYSSNNEYLIWHIGIMAELGTYKNFIDSELFTLTLDKSRNNIPSVSRTKQEQLPLFINLFKISIATGNSNLIKTYKNMFLQRAEILLTPDQYTSIKTQIDQLG